MPMSEWELWACANKLIADHGEAAADQAALRASALLERGDHAGCETWIAIRDRIDALQWPGDTIPN